MADTVRFDSETLSRLSADVAPRYDADGRRVRALVLYSGGLDSTLAALLMKLQGIDVVAVHMFTGFCLTDHQRKAGKKGPDGAPIEHEALAGGAAMEIPVEIVDVREGYMQVLTDPKFGWGSSVNPCIDCRIHMLGKAKRELLDEYEAHFVVTGEVLGQRPMTQLSHRLRLIERESGLEGLIVRPLSQQLLPVTIPEKRGWVDRAKLLAITGRGRKPQMELARELGLVRWPQPAGGCCFLTDGNYGKRLRDTIDHTPKERIGFEDVLVLKVGRHFRLPGGNKLVVGRNEADNQMLRAYWTLGHFLEARDVQGPLALFQGDRTSDDLALACRIVARYADVPEGSDVVVDERFQDDAVDEHRAQPLRRGEEAAWILN